MKINPNELSFLLQLRVPLEACVALSLVLCMGVFYIFRLKKNKEQKIQYIGLLCFVIYLFIVLCNTVLFRPEGTTSRVVLIPFWSYVEAINKDRSFYLVENLLNIVLFIPIGIFLKMGFPHVRLVPIMVCGLLLSMAIETSQLLLHRGWFEVDDLMHNTIGSVIGYLALRKIIHNTQQRTTR